MRFLRTSRKLKILVVLIVSILLPLLIYIVFFPEKPDIRLIRLIEESKDLQEIEKLLQEGVNPNTSHLLLTPLIQSVWADRSDLARLLLRYGADPSKGNVNGTTALMVTASYPENRMHFFQIFLTAKEEYPKVKKSIFLINQQDNNGNTALMLAVKEGNLEEAAALIKMGADISIINKNGESALTVAEKMRRESVRSFSEQTEIYEKLIDLLWRKEHRLLFTAARNGDLKLVKRAFALKIPVGYLDPDGYSALFYSILNGNFNVSNYLISRGADLQKGGAGRSVLLRLSSSPWLPSGRVKKTLKYLKEKRVDFSQITERGESALIFAIKSGQYVFLRELLILKADTEIEDDFGNTAFIVATDYGHRKMMEALYKAKADINHTNKNGNNALTKMLSNSLAEEKSQQQNLELCRDLIKYGIDLSVKNKFGYTALKIARRRKFREIEKLLSENLQKK